LVLGRPRAWSEDGPEKAAKDIVEYDVLPVAVKEFSGILCIDEAYSGKLAILLAVDPKRNDRLVGFSLSDKGIDKEHVKTFLEKLKNTGIMPDQVVTDGSALYPEVVKEVWPRVNHQLCLFHATKRLTELAKKAIRDLKKLVPKQPHATGGYATKDDVVATLQLYRDGLSLRQIAKRVGVSRNSVKTWIKNPQLVASRYGINIESSIIPVSENKENMNKNNRNPLINLPDGWSSWDQVNNVTAALKKLAFQISSRHLTTNEDSRECYNSCLESPIGSRIKPIRAFLEDWYDMFTEAATAAAKWQSMRNKSLEESCSRFKTFQSQMSDEMFEKLSTIFKDEEFEATSNGAERFARKVKRIQKSRYRLRTPTSMRDFMLLERVLHEEALKHGDMEHSNPFRKFF
jgi:lambda repressor-like predicted transcriptional regulator